jgi:hydroxypyruvate reductase
VFTETVFYTRSLQDSRIGRILAAALNAVEPGQAVQHYLGTHPLPPARRVYALGLGKAAIPMTRALAETTTLAGALAIAKHAAPLDLPGAVVLAGGHPVPDARSLQAGQAALDFVADLQADDLLVCLISGGGSALMSAPRPGLTLDDLQTLTRLLLSCGARIDEINALRRRLDRVKGGGLALACPAPIISLILSDVVGNPLETIASGPTAPDPTTHAAALAVIARYGLTGTIPSAVLAALETAPETPKPGAAVFVKVENVLVGSNALAAQAALRQAEIEGFTAEFLGDDWQGEARQTALRLCERLEAPGRAPRPLCLVAGGETTVTLQGNGRGGRNQELALAAVAALAGIDGAALITLATDGEDGPTDAAGAMVTSQSLARARLAGLDPADYLQRNDAYSFFAALGDLLRTGPTGTNVNDLTFLFLV